MTDLPSSLKGPTPTPGRVNPLGSVSWPLLLMTRSHTRAGFPGPPWTGLHRPPSPVPDVSTSVWLHGASHKAFLVNMPEIPCGFQTCPATFSAPCSFPPLLADHTISHFSFCVLSAGSAHLLILKALIKRHDSSCLTTRYHVKSTMLSPLCMGTPGVDCFSPCGSRERRTMIALASSPAHSRTLGDGVCE